tara:strand:+ start:131 stop:982 length:852 start_codon:yes stop_codon:yes gene_type:complete
MFTLVSWNIQYGKGFDGRIDLVRIAETINKDGLPDVLCLQEISRNYPSIDEGADQVKKLESLFPDYESYFGAAHDRLGVKGKTRKQFGNLVLTRIQPVQVLHHLLPSPADTKSSSMSRQITELFIPANTTNLRLMTTHLEFFSKIQQLAQIQRIREIHEEASCQFYKPGIDKPNTPFELISRPENTIICGDFNFIPDSTSYKKMTASFYDKNINLVDAWKVHQRLSSHPPTCGIFDFKQWKNGPHCRDYFFMTQSLAQKINNISVNTESDASDHQPIRLMLNV